MMGQCTLLVCLLLGQATMKAWRDFLITPPNTHCLLLFLGSPFPNFILPHIVSSISQMSSSLSPPSLMPFFM